MPVLVLNASYEPVNITRARRALVLLIKGVAVIEEAHDRFVHVGYRCKLVGAGSGPLTHILRDTEATL